MNDCEFVLPCGEKIDIDGIEENFVAGDMPFIQDRIVDKKFVIIFLLKFG